MIRPEQMPSETVIVFAGGDAPDLRRGVLLPPDSFVIAADSGLENAMRFGRRVDLVVGDMDSVSPTVLEVARAAGTVVEVHPTAKDRTDLELALDRAKEMGARRVEVVGGSGNRLDHLLANALLFAASTYEAMTIRAYMGTACLGIVRSHVAFEGIPGELVTLLPLSCGSNSVTTSGLLYPLDGEALSAGSTRGVSNEMVGSVATIIVSSGVIAVVRPGQRGCHGDATGILSSWT